MIVHILPAKKRHIEAIASRVRPDDARELWAFALMAPARAMEYSLERSAVARTGFVDGVPVCMFGVVPAGSSFTNTGRPWMVGTDLLEKHQATFLRRCRGQVAEMLGKFERLENFVDERNARAIAWLKWLGFEMHESAPLGELGTAFVRFSRDRVQFEEPAVPGLISGAGDMLEKIVRLEGAMTRGELGPVIHIEPRHYFAAGLYAREITIPAGVTLTGKVHKFEHLNIISKGKIRVWTEDGMRDIEAPATIISRPGMKRVGYAIEETVWTTIHATPLGPETDPDDVEASLVCATVEEYQLYLGTAQALEIEEG